MIGAIMLALTKAGGVITGIEAAARGVKALVGRDREEMTVEPGAIPTTGEEKHNEAVSILSRIIGVGELVAKRDIVDEVEFAEGLSMLVKAIVKMFNASIWHKSKTGTTTTA